MPRHSHLALAMVVVMSGVAEGEEGVTTAAGVSSTPMPHLGDVTPQHTLHPTQYQDDTYTHSIQPILDDNFSESFNGSSDEFQEWWSEDDKKVWLSKQLQRRQSECHQLQQLEANTSTTNTEAWCPRVWDQMLCWSPTPPNTTTTQPCPHYIPGIIAQGEAERVCGADGQWEGGKELGWTNYSACLPVNSSAATVTTFTVLEVWLPTIKRMSVVGYSVSLATLVISFTILASLRKLRCPRNLLHLHLFASFILRAVVVLLKSSLMLHGLALPDDFDLQDAHHQHDLAATQTWACKLMICVWQYFILANYSWLLMEGLYLHSLIFMALFTDSSAITLYILLGWGMPLGCVVVWAALRATLDDAHCWTVNNVQWIFWLCIRAPVALSNLINFFFFLNVVRVLILKLRSSISAESMIYRKLGKSTLVLVPLFGVHYFLLWGLSTSTNAHVELVWLFLDQVFASFQGFFVAVLYCLMNGEVRQELRKLYNRWYKGDPVTVNSQSTLISHTKTYPSRGRTSLHSIHSQAERRDRQSPSPQMAHSNGGEAPATAHTHNTTPSPTNTLTPDNAAHQQSKDAVVNESWPEWCEEAIELRTRPPTSDGGGPSPSKCSLSDPRPSAPALTPIPTNCERTPVEVLIELQDGEQPDSKEVYGPDPAIEDAPRAKHLTFSESTEQFQNAKLKPVKANGCAVTEESCGMEDDHKGRVCVNVSQKSLKSAAQVQIDSCLVKQNKGKENETML